MDRIETLVAARNKKYYGKGIFWGLLGGFLCAMPSVFASKAMSLEPLASSMVLGLLVVPVVSVFIRDTVGVIANYAVLLSTGKNHEISRALRTKAGRMMIFSALFGGPVAGICSTTGVFLAGPVFSTAIGASFPAIGAILSRIFLKENINLRKWIAIGLCVVGAVVISWTPPEGNYPLFYVGLLFELIAAVAWALEGVVSTGGMDFIDPVVASTISKIYSSLMHLFFTLPFVAGFGFKAYKLVGQTIASESMIYLVLAGITMGIGYIYYFKSNHAVGAAKGEALDITYVFWNALISIVWLHVSITVGFVVGAIILIAGSLLVSIDPAEFVVRKTS